MRGKQYIVILTLSCFFLCSCGTQKLVLNTPAMNTRAFECIQITGDNSCIVSVQETGSDVQNATQKSIRNAVFEILFNGIPGSNTNRIPDQKALVSDQSIRTTKKEYFDSFFSDNKYLSFAELLHGTVPAVVKTASGYRVTVSVLVKKEALRKRLEEDEIILSLSNAL